jgi:hypothetical protein
MTFELNRMTVFQPQKKSSEFTAERNFSLADKSIHVVAVKEC